MGKIVISTNASLDGVVQDPDGREGFRLGGWFGQFGGYDLETAFKYIAMSGYDGIAGRREVARRRGKLLGIGVATTVAEGSFTRG